ncbi:tetratricopeptide repeat protein [Methylophaga sp. OBS3]|uniref:tetratricopeptide repeat protein n=1 Tax=Methylophaga sp. OBS3 TaxID=2991934 RepID=UPI00225BBA26|nr:tetratricopeptide repeat protein [Methylophaga sp. OBS3]MCX4189564.1 tetratricopeptide repeat protein [Methylophaga sp. OBS3]
MLNLKKYRLFFVAFALAGLSACSTSPIYSPPVESRTTPPAEKQPEPKVEPEQPQGAQASGIEAPPEAIEETRPAPAAPFRSKPAVIALMGSARAAQRQGDYQSAQNDLQRAQRIAPRDPNIYFELADTHYQMQDYALAEQVALKGVSVAGQDRDLLRKFWLLISEIRYAAGNNAGGASAAREAEQY